jgi:hypothetical protein
MRTLFIYTCWRLEAEGRERGRECVVVVANDDEEDAEDVRSGEERRSAAEASVVTAG